MYPSSIGPALIAAAIMLAVIEYMLGVAFMTIKTSEMKLVVGGIKLKGLMSLGREMAENGTLSVVLIGALGAIMIVVRQIPIFLYGGDINTAYQYFGSWCLQKTLFVQGLLAGFAGAEMAASALISPLNLVPGMAIYEPCVKLLFLRLSPIIGALGTANLILGALGSGEPGFISLSSLLKTDWMVFIAFGALLYALPWRIGRGAGSTLIMFGSVLYVSLPLLPIFVDFFEHQMTTLVSLNSDSCPIMIAFIFNQIYTCTTFQTNQIFNSYMDACGTYVFFEVWVLLFLSGVYLGIIGLVAAGVSRLLGATQTKLIPFLGV